MQSIHFFKYAPKSNLPTLKLRQQCDYPLHGTSLTSFHILTNIRIRNFRIVFSVFLLENIWEWYFWVKPLRFSIPFRCLSVWLLFVSGCHLSTVLKCRMEILDYHIELFQLVERIHSWIEAVVVALAVTRNLLLLFSWFAMMFSVELWQYLYGWCCNRLLTIHWPKIRADIIVWEWPKIVRTRAN